MLIFNLGYVSSLVKDIVRCSIGTGEKIESEHLAGALIRVDQHGKSGNASR